MPADSQRAHELLAKIMALPPGDRRAAVDRECGGDSDLRREVESLLAASGELPDTEHAQAAARAAMRDAVTLDAEPAREASRTENTRSPDTTHDATHLDPHAVIAGRYTLQARIGVGGMGEVWAAQQTEPVKRRVALKLIKTGMDSHAVLGRFEQERQALAIMDHPNIARVLDGGVTPSGQPFFAMELVDGPPLTKFCDDARLSLRERLVLFVPICQAVQHAHQKGIVHRDLKPSNILVTRVDGRPVPKVIDFGVAKATGGKLTDETLHTQFGALVGTLEYMAPEQAGGSAPDVDTRADIYSLGVILYELLTGLRPIDARRLRNAALVEMLRVIQEEEPPRPSTRLTSEESLPSLAALRQIEPRRLPVLLRGELDWVVMKCLEKSRERRYESASGLARDLERYLADEPVEARPASTGYRMSKFIRRHKGPVLAAGLVVLALVGGISGTTYGQIKAERARQIAVNAKLAETERAEGERLAKLDAEAANRRAHRRLEQLEKANDILGSIFQNLDPNEIALAERPLQAILVEKLLEAAGQLDGEAIGDRAIVASIQEKLAYSLAGLGEPAASIKLFREIRNTREAEFGPTHPETFKSTNDIAAALARAGEIASAIELYEQLIQQQTEALGANHATTQLSRFNLAEAYHRAGKPERAVPILEELMQYYRDTLGPEHRETKDVLNNLAAAYEATGKTDLALPMFEEYWQHTRETLGSHHPRTLEGANNLAYGYMRSRRLDRAVSLLEETLATARQHLGPDHPVTLQTMHNLGDAFAGQRKFELALPLAQETLRLTRAKRGADHPDTMGSLNQLGTCFYHLGKFDQAIPLFAETLQIAEKRLSPDHPQTLTTIDNLAASYDQVQQFDKSIPLIETLIERQGGPSAAATGWLVVRLATQYRGAGRAAGALPSLEQARRAATDRSARHQLALVLGDTYVEAGQPDHAATLGREMADAARAESPDASTELAGALGQIGRLFLRAQASSDAETVLRECLAIREQNQPGHWLLFHTMSMLGDALLRQKKYQEAEPLLRRGFEGLLERAAAIPMPAQFNLGDARARLVKLLEETDRKDEADQLRRKP